MRVKTIAEIVISAVVVLSLLAMAYTLGENRGKKYRPFKPEDCVQIYLEIYNNCLSGLKPFTLDCPEGTPPSLCCADAVIASACHDLANAEAIDFYYKQALSYYFTQWK